MHTWPTASSKPRTVSASREKRLALTRGLMVAGPAVVFSGLVAFYFEVAAEIASVADAAVVGSALVDRITANLDDNGKAGPGTVDAVLDLVRTLAEGVRNAQNTEKAS